LLYCATLVYTIYEVGYIQNDTESIKKEKNPTLRLGEKDLAYYERHKRTIYAARVALGAAGAALLLWRPNSSCAAVAFCCLLSALIPCYCLYNNIRNGWALPINSTLIFIRYAAPLLATGCLSGEVAAAIVFGYPLINFIERAATSKLAIPFFAPLISSKQRLAAFRICYYLAVLAPALCYHFFVASIPVFLFLMIYYLTYRCLTYFIPKEAL
jgi:hypothetical protein